MYVISLLVSVAVHAVSTQPAPQPFPSPIEPSSESDRTSQPVAENLSKPITTPSSSNQQIPTTAMDEFPIYPGSKFLGSYDAGRGQRLYLYGSNISFSGLISYYTGILKSRGDRIFEEPATHIFEIGRFRRETMAFRPGITIKDYTWGGAPGYLDPRLGANPARFSTVIQIVLPPSDPIH